MHTQVLSRSHVLERLRGLMGTPEKIYVFFAMLYFVGALSPSDVGENEMTRQWHFDQVSYLMQLLIFPVLALVIFAHWQSVWQGIKEASWPLALCGLAILSAGWSDDPFFSARRAIILLMTTLFAIYLGSRFSLEEHVNLFAWLLIFSVVGSICVIVFAPQLGISHDLHEGALKGMFSHKNLLGRQMAFGILALVVGKPVQIPKWLRYGCLILAFLLLLLSRSAGALITLAIVLAFCGFLRLPKKGRRSTAPLWIGLVPVLVALVILAITNADIFLEPLGRDTSLTGRVPLWAAIGQAIGQQPWLGHGYAIFWVHTSASLLAVVATGWNALSAQNGYLDLCLDLGLVGLALFFCSLAYSMRLGLKYFHNGLVRSSQWPLVFLLFFTLQNFHESDLLRLGTFMWIPFVATSVSLALLEKRLLREAVSSTEQSEEGLPAFSV